MKRKRKSKKQGKGKGKRKRKMEKEQGNGKKEEEKERKGNMFFWGRRKVRKQTLKTKTVGKSFLMRRVEETK